MTAPFLRRSTANPSGIATGGGDTDFAKQPQPHLYTQVLTSEVTSKDVLIPKGAIILAYVVVPHGNSGGPDTGVLPTAGTVTIDTWNITTNASISSLLGATSAQVYSRTAVVSPVPQTADVRVRFRSSSMTPAATGAVHVGLEMILPATRS
jgi:hypothetical protein